MDYKSMFLKGIESDRQSLSAYIKRYGYKENLGQNEYSDFRDRVNKNEKLSYSEKAELCSRFTEMLNAL